MLEESSKVYNASEAEDKIYKRWEDSGFFNPDNLPERHKEPFSIVLPPPNVTGTLHLGSALMLVIQDIMIRFERMRGKKTLWLPGTDHAAIATETKVDKLIQKEEGKSRKDLGREEFLKRVNKFALEQQTTINSQMKLMGVSLDWSREAYTLDEPRSLAVRTAFKKMYDAGIIYRGHRVINWDPKGQTAVSDDEIEYQTRQTKLYTFHYSKEFPIPIASTQPETKVGDTAVAVHPNDKRYQKYIGQEFDLEFAGNKIHLKIVGDNSVDPEFGTGALGVTPAHSIIDSEIAQRHNLPSVQIINEYARMTDEAGPLVAGKKTTEAREIGVNWLKEQGLIEKEEIIEQNVPTAQRSGGIIEPLPKLQWFVNVNKPTKERDNKTLKELMREPIAGGRIKILPERFEKVYNHWIDNLHDWNISRQIWFGHQIPVWYKDEEIYCDIEAPKGEGWTQDPDTLDTWFSSGLWTFSTLGWPEKTKDLDLYHPTAILETGYDILFFWVARMILMSQFLLGEIPFKTVYLHGLVRDEKNQKISKSLGNNIEPADMIARYGADSIRMAMIVGTSPGSDSKVSTEKFKAYKHFANKLWNIARFVLMSIPNDAKISKIALTNEDQKLLNDLKTIITDITEDMEQYRFYLAAEKIYHYIWHTFADKIIEESKTKLASEDPTIKASAQQMLLELLTTCLKLLHPFMPFITEEIYLKLPVVDKKLLMVEKWPV